MSNGFGSFRSSPNGYVSYKVFKEIQEGGGGKGPSSNGSCLSTNLYAMAFVVGNALTIGAGDASHDKRLVNIELTILSIARPLNKDFEKTGGD